MAGLLILSFHPLEDSSRPLDVHPKIARGEAVLPPAKRFQPGDLVKVEPGNASGVVHVGLIISAGL